MIKNMRKNSSYNWQLVIVAGTIAIPIIFILVLYWHAPDTFWTEIINEKGEIIDKLFNYEKTYEMFIDGVAAWGAVMIGVIALTQSESSQRLAENLAERENSCNIVISNSANFNQIGNKLSNDSVSPYEESDEYVFLSFINHSAPFLKTVKIVFDNNLVFQSYLTLVNGEEKNYKIYLPVDFDFSTNTLCNIVFTSCNNEKTYGDFKIKSEDDGKNSIMHYHFYGMEDNNGIDL